MATKQYTAPKKLVASTILFFVLLVASLTILNPPQCPENYTQTQIDASNCVIGANIGSGLLVMVLLPYLAVLLFHWMKYLDKDTNKPKSSANKSSRP